MSVDRSVVRGIALFVDLENLVAGAFTAGLVINLEPVVATLKEFGPVRLRRAYGDLTKTVESASRGERAQSELKDIRRMLQRNVFEIMDIPFLTAHKNACDMHLALDALSLAYTNEGITHYAILSSDRDYVPLFSRLRELGKSVIAIAVDPQMTNTASLREGSDHLLYYSEIVTPKEVSESPVQEPALELEPALLGQYQDLLLRALSALERQGKKLVGTEVAQMMSRLESDFDPKRIGCPNFKALVVKLHAEKGLKVRIPDGAGDLVFESPAVLPPPPPAITPPPPPTRTPAAPQSLWLKEAIGRVIKVPLPNAAKRRLIFDTLFESYSNRIKEGPFLLTELSDHAGSRLRSHAIDDPTVYKIGLSLYFSRCFQCEPGVGPNNPSIVGLARPSEDWERYVFANFVRAIIRNERRTPTVEELAEVLFEKDAKLHHDFCRRVIAQAAD